MSPITATALAPSQPLLDAVAPLDVAGELAALQREQASILKRIADLQARHPSPSRTAGEGRFSRRRQAYDEAGAEKLQEMILAWDEKHRQPFDESTEENAPAAYFIELAKVVIAAGEV